MFIFKYVWYTSTCPQMYGSKSLVGNLQMCVLHLQIVSDEILNKLQLVNIQIWPTKSKV